MWTMHFVLSLYLLFAKLKSINYTTHTTHPLCRRMNIHCVYFGISKTFQRNYIDLFCCCVLRFQLLIFVSPPFSLSTSNVFAKYSQSLLLQEKDSSYFSFSPFRSFFYLNLYWMKWSLITFSIFFSLRTNLLNPKRNTQHTHTWKKQNFKKNIEKKTHTQKQIYQKI